MSAKNGSHAARASATLVVVMTPNTSAPSFARAGSGQPSATIQANRGNVSSRRRTWGFLRTPIMGARALSAALDRGPRSSVREHQFAAHLAAGHARESLA